MGNISKAIAALRRTKEVVAIGDSATAKRPIFKTLAVAGVTLGIGVVAANGLISSTSHGDLNMNVSSAIERGTAQVVGKVYQPAGGVLGEDIKTLNEAVWQPMKDAVGSQYQLVLALDNEVAVIAVSPEVFNSYCKHARVPTEYPSSAGCSRVFDSHPSLPAGPVPLDEVAISFTRNITTGDLQIVEFDGHPKAAASFSELLKLKKAFKDQYKQSQAPEMATRVRTATLG